jgi:glyoxylase-like metal-dependent hydrolase (beta-lactamase superfamily II)
MKLGALEVHAISDGFFHLDGGQMFSVVPKVLWEKRLAADERNRLRLGLTCLVIQTGRQNILVETGIGDKFDAKQREIFGIEPACSLPDELRKLGLRVEDIDIVINTHLHFDHCGWNVRNDGGKLVPTFPRAKYLIQRAEWEDAHHATERNRASYIESFFGPAEKQTEFLDGTTEIVPGVSVEIGAGHTRCMQCVKVESGGQVVYFPSDLVATSAHLPLAWMTSFDLYPLQTLANKKRFLPELAESGSILVFAHDPKLLWARLAMVDGKIVAQGLEQSANF